MNKERKPEYSKELKKLTKETLYEMPVAAFINEGVCHLKNIDGRFGFITLSDAMHDNYTIRFKDNAEVKSSYPSIKMLIEDGWVVD
jgi:hypothetical protein